MCGETLCTKCKGMKVAIVGLLVLLNAWRGFLDWSMFIGIVLLLWGLVNWMKPSCPCHDRMCGTMPIMTKKRR